MRETNEWRHGARPEKLTAAEAATIAAFPSSAWNLLNSQRKPERVGRLQMSDRSRLLSLEAVMRIPTLIAALATPLNGAMALLATPGALALSLSIGAPLSSLGQPLRVIVLIDDSKVVTPTVACVPVIA